MGTRATASLSCGTSQGGQLHTIGPLGLFQRFAQALRAHRFDQIAHCTDLEGFQSELIMRRAKDHRWRRFALAQFGSHLQAVEAGHADIQQDHIRLEAINQGQGFLAIAGGGLQDPVTLELTDHAAQALAGKGFVIDDQDIHIALASCVSLAQG